MHIKKQRRIYLDYAGATPIDKEVLKVTSLVQKEFHGNPSSLHREGRDAKKIMEDARIKIAGLMSAHPDEIIFTSGGTEANKREREGGGEKRRKKKRRKRKIEKGVVCEQIRKLEREGAEVTYLKPDNQGLIDPKSLRDALRPNTVLVSIIYANNEIGTIEPVKDIAKVVRHFRTEHKQSLPYFHTDAAQAACYLSLDTTKLGFDLITIDGGKIYGPKSTGILYKKRSVELLPQMLGGGQERGLRSGTENVSLVTGLAKALEINEKLKARESVRVGKLRDYFIKKLIEISGASINGTISERLPNNVSVCIKSLDAEFAVYQLDERGIAVSSASTCMNLKEDSYSYVVEEIGRSDCKSSSLRFSLGRSTSKSDIDICLRALKEVLLMQRWNISPDNKRS